MRAEVGREHDLYAYMEEMQRSTEEAKDLLLPQLQMLDAGRPWSVDCLTRLQVEADDLSCETRDAIAHVWEYEVPLLRFEEQLEQEDLAYVEYEARLRTFELGFWRERFSANGDGERPERAPTAPEYVCKHHQVTAADIRRTARETGRWDVQAVAGVTGATTTCGSCRLHVTRILIDELRAAKAEGRER